VRLPALVGPAVARPADDRGSRRGALAGRVQAAGAVVDGELAGGGPRPRLVAAAVAVPELHLRAGCRARAVDVQALAERAHRARGRAGGGARAGGGDDLLGPGRPVRAADLDV